MGITDKLHHKFNKNESKELEKEGGRALGKQNLSGEAEKEHKENRFMDQTATYANKIDQKAGELVGRENLSGTKGGIGTKMTGDTTNSPGTSSHPGYGATDRDYYDTSDRQPSSLQRSSGDDTFGSSKSGKYGARNKEEFGSDSAGPHGLQHSGDPESRNKYGQEATAAEDIDASRTGAAGYGASLHHGNSEHDSSNTRHNVGDQGGHYTYGKGGPGLGYEGPRSHTGSRSHDLGGFTTGDEQLDAKIASLDPSVQEQAKEAFHRGYQDAQNAFKS